MEVDRISLVCRGGNPLAVVFLFHTHQGEREPRVRPGHELTVEFQVQSCGIARTEVLSKVRNLHILNVIRDEVRQRLEICFGREFEGTIEHLEAVVHGCDELQGALTLDVLVEHRPCQSVDCHRVAHLLVERRLVIESCGKAEGVVGVEGGNEGQRGSGRHDGLFVERPVRQSDTIVQREEVVALVEMVGVLYVGLDAMALHVVLCRQRVDQIQTVRRVWDGIAAGVAHFIFPRRLFDLFDLVGEAGLDVVAACLVRAHQFEAHHVGGQVVPGVLHICSHAEILARLRVIQPVLSHDVVSLFLLGVEGGCEELDFGGVSERACDGGGAKIGTEHILLLSVEIDLERFRVGDGAEGGLTRLWREVVMILRDVSDQFYLPSLVGSVSDICLIIKEIRLILSTCFEGA